MAKKTVKKSSGNPMDLHFPDIPMQDEPKDRNEDKNSDVERLARIEASLANLQDENKSLKEANLRLMATPTPTVERAAPQRPSELSYDGLPDPVEKPKEYATEIAKRIEARAALERDYEREQARSASEKAQRIGSLWTGFSSNYPDLAKDQSRVEFAATKLAERMKARGVDVEKYMFTTQDQFFKDLKGEIEAIFGKAAGEDDGDGAEGSDDDGAGDRSAATLSGTISNAKGSVREKSAETNMTADLQKLQRASGFF